MKQRVNYTAVAPEAFKALLGVEEYVRKTGLDYKMIELVKIRVSQINGCAYCLDMHTIDTRAHGETEQRIYCLPAWRESPFYTDQERAALEMAEAVTLISTNGVSDELYQKVREQFSEKEFIDLLMAIIAINSWNRLAISSNAIPGNYKPALKK
ncbi:carboxymuconolactone decarboxylase family protein [Brevibacillus sp. SYSU BS000544]|uniref:carboxymuconolactone decarboxylase family protein n=1 Tax=Brevibacillus sp. SYSU BS000544 TaxID=3416443 RepID=UPI003CE50BEE